MLITKKQLRKMISETINEVFDYERYYFAFHIDKNYYEKFRNFIHSYDSRFRNGTAILLDSKKNKKLKMYPAKMNENYITFLLAIEEGYEAIEKNVFMKNIIDKWITKYPDSMYHKIALVYVHRFGDFVENKRIWNIFDNYSRSRSFSEEENS